MANWAAFLHGVFMKTISYFNLGDVARLLLVAVSLLASVGCKSTSTSFDTPYATTYHPLSPISVYTIGMSPENQHKVYESELGRSSIETFDGEGKFNGYGTTATVKGSTANITEDFFKYRTHPVPVVLTQEENNRDIADRNQYYGDFHARSPQDYDALSSELKQKERLIMRSAIPVYVGSGVRIEAHVTSLSGDVEFSSLPALGASASAKKATGKIMVGTMGVSGDSVGLLFQSGMSLNEATVQNAIQAVGAVKATIAMAGNDANGKPRVHLRPMIIGFELSDRRPAVIAAVRAFLYSAAYSVEIKSEGTAAVSVIVTADTTFISIPYFVLGLSVDLAIEDLKGLETEEERNSLAAATIRNTLLKAPELKRKFATDSTKTALGKLEALKLSIQEAQETHKE